MKPSGSSAHPAHPFRRWSKLSPSQQLEELVQALRHEESASRTRIGREAVEALDAISDEFEVLRAVALLASSVQGGSVPVTGRAFNP